MPMRRERYPADWKRISASIRARAGDCCEWPGCGVANGSVAISVKGKPYPIVLTTAHLDHDPQNNDPANLRSYCQTHHLRYDAAHHAKNAAATRREKQMRALLDCMQEVITTKCMVWRCCPPVTARLLNMWLWLIGAWIVAKMRELECVA